MRTDWQNARIIHKALDREYLLKLDADDYYKGVGFRKMKE